MRTTVVVGQVEARREARVRIIAATRIQSVIRGKFGRSEVGRSVGR